VEFAICRKPLLLSGAMPRGPRVCCSPLEGTGFETSVPHSRERISLSVTCQLVSPIAKAWMVARALPHLQGASRVNWTDVPDAESLHFVLPCPRLPHFVELEGSSNHEPARRRNAAEA
jgi:hypothetical protein